MKVGGIIANEGRQINEQEHHFTRNRGVWVTAAHRVLNWFEVWAYVYHWVHQYSHAIESWIMVVEAPRRRRRTEHHHIAAMVMI